ncbi:MAG TPA: hypothetical protein VIR26_04640 [Metalysinibacillus sp.]
MLAQQLQRITNVGTITSFTTSVKIDGVMYATSGKANHLRTPETMAELMQVIIKARNAQGKANEAAEAVTLKKALEDFKNVFEVIGIS